MLNENFERLEDAIEAVKATIDDVDAATVLVTTTLADDEGEPLPEVGLILTYCTGRYGFISRLVAAHLLNDGILNRLRVPLRFI